jgi:hypothetical protein
MSLTGTRPLLTEPSARHKILWETAGFVTSAYDCVRELCTALFCQGHLGDQDFYTLLAMEYPDLVHLLPCVWNRQLCTWWRDHGYRDVFDAFAYCNGSVKLYHGNCNTPVPTDWRSEGTAFTGSIIQTWQLAACHIIYIQNVWEWLKWWSCLVMNAIAHKTHNTFPKSPSNNNYKYFVWKSVV